MMVNATTHSQICGYVVFRVTPGGRKRKRDLLGAAARAEPSLLDAWY